MPPGAATLGGLRAAVTTAAPGWEICARGVTTS
jgi:hypothetical protein